MSDNEQCPYCGRFMKHVWFQTSDEPDSWEDTWSCSLNSQHKKDHPEDYS